MTIVIDGHLSDVAIAVVGGLITILLVTIWQRSSGWIRMQLRRAYAWSVTILSPTLKAARKPRRIAMVSTDGKSPIVQDQAYEELVRQLETARRELARLRANSRSIKAADIVGGVKATGIFSSVKLGDAIRSVRAADIVGDVKMGDAVGTAFGIERPMP